MPGTKHNSFGALFLLLVVSGARVDVAGVQAAPACPGSYLHTWDSPPWKLVDEGNTRSDALRPAGNRDDGADRLPMQPSEWISHAHGAWSPPGQPLLHVATGSPAHTPGMPGDTSSGYPAARPAPSARSVFAGLRDELAAAATPATAAPVACLAGVPRVPVAVLPVAALRVHSALTAWKPVGFSAAWSRGEDDALRLGVALYGKRWLTILRNPHFSRALQERSTTNLEHRWNELQRVFKEQALGEQSNYYHGLDPRPRQHEAMQNRSQALLLARAAEQGPGRVGGRDAGLEESSAWKALQRDGRAARFGDRQPYVTGDGRLRLRKATGPWSGHEHSMVMQGLRALGWGSWAGIAKEYIPTRSPSEVATHAASYFFGITRPFPASPSWRPPEHITVPPRRHNSPHASAQMRAPDRAQAALAGCTAIVTPKTEGNARDARRWLTEVRDEDFAAAEGEADRWHGGGGADAAR